MIRIITAIFLKETLAAAAADQEHAIRERMRKRDKDIAQLRAIFTDFDEDGTGFVTLDEFKRILEDPYVKTWLQVLELEVNEVTGLFRLLDNGDGTISFDEFVSGVMRMRGGAKAVDLVTLLYENKKIVDRLESLKQMTEVSVAAMQRVTRRGTGRTAS